MEKAGKVGAMLAGLVSTLAAGAELYDRFVLHHKDDPAVTAAPAESGVPGTQVALATTTAIPVDHTGPIRLAVLPFKNVGSVKDEEIASIGGGVEEEVVTDLGGSRDVKLIEKDQLSQASIAEVDFGQSKYVDPATRAQIGKINGAEVVLIGGFQKAGKNVRVTARFVSAETGEILEALKVERPAKDVFKLQDEVAKQALSVLPKLKKRLRA